MKRMIKIAAALAILMTAACLVFAPAGHADYVHPDIAYNCYVRVLEDTYNEFYNDNFGSGFSWVLQDYSLYDIDGNGIMELLVKAGTCEADYMHRIYTIRNNAAVYIGETFGGHSSLFECSTSAGFYNMFAQMGSEEIVKVTYVNGMIKHTSISLREVGDDEEYSVPGRPMDYAAINDYNVLLLMLYGDDYEEAGAPYNIGTIGFLNKDKVNIRTGPSASHSALGWVHKGDEVIILEKVGSWYHVLTVGGVEGYYKAYSGIEGYIMAEYINPGSSSATPKFPPVKLPAAAIGVVTVHQVTKNGANVRVQPDEYSAMAGFIPMNTSYLCYSMAANGWREILLPTGARGFVSGKLVDFSANIGTARTYSSPIGTVKTTADSSRTYAAPSFSADFMGSIFRGNTYQCVDIIGDWYCIANPIKDKGDWVVYIHKDNVQYTAIN